MLHTAISKSDADKLVKANLLARDGASIVEVLFAIACSGSFSFELVCST